MVFPYFTFSIGVTTASAAILGIAMTSKIKALKTDWKNQRCKPHGMLAAGIPGVRPRGVSASQNFKECQLGMFQGYFSTFITPITSIIYVLTDIVTEISNNIQNIRYTIMHIRNGLEKTLGSVLSKIYNLETRLAWLFKKVITIIGSIFNVFVDLFGILKYAFYTMSTIWNGTVGSVLRFFCFDGDTEIETDNTSILLKNIKIGDTLKGNNKVLGTFKFTSRGTQMYKYNIGNDLLQNNIIVAGSHLVNENGKWIRVEDSSFATIINYKKKYIYCLSTSNAKININNILFADYLETTNKDVISKMYNLILNHLNNQFVSNQIVSNKIIHPTEMLYHWGVAGNTKINVMGNIKNIKQCKIGDKLSDNNIILGLVKFKVEEQTLYNYNGVLCTGSMIVYENNSWIPVLNSNMDVISKHRCSYMYNIFTSNNTFESNKITFCDFEQTNNNKINSIIDKELSTHLST
jgi:hypothetical protein